MYKKSLTHYVAKITIDVLFFISTICTIAIPFFYRAVFDFIGYSHKGYLPYFAILLFASGLVCTYILFILKQMYKSLLVGNPFTEKNVSYLRKIAISCMLISLMYFAKLFFAFTIATLVIIAVFAVGCLFCLTLKDLFKQAINYKLENELTI